MKAFQISATVLATALLWGCASSPPPATDFPAGARTPSAAEVAAALGGKSFNVPGPRGMIRSDYAVQANGLAVFYPGGSDTGTWRAEEGRICMAFKKLQSVCNDMRLAGSDIYMKRSNGDVVRMEPLK